MKIKKTVLIIITSVLTLLSLSGCINSTYVLKLKKNGNMDTSFTFLYDLSGFEDEEKELINEYIISVKDQFSDIGYTIKEKSDLGLNGYSATKIDITQLDDKFVDKLPYNVDILDDIRYHMDFDEKARCNTYEIETDIDLTSFSNIPDFLKEKVTQEEYLKMLSQMNLKLVIELEDGAIEETDAQNVSVDKRKAEWVLIPGNNNSVKLKAVMGVNTAWISSMIICGSVIFIAALFMIVFMKMYKKKNMQED